MSQCPKKIWKSASWSDLLIIIWRYNGAVFFLRLSKVFHLCRFVDSFHKGFDEDPLDDVIGQSLRLSRWLAVTSEGGKCYLLPFNSITITLSLCSWVLSIHFYLFFFSVFIAESVSAQTAPRRNNSKSMGAAATATARWTYTLRRHFPICNTLAT